MAGISEFMDLQEKRIRRRLQGRAGGPKTVQTPDTRVVRHFGKERKEREDKLRAEVLDDIETRGVATHSTGARKLRLDELDGEESND